MIRLLGLTLAGSLALGGCSSLLTEGSAAGAGVGAAAVSNAFTKNGAVTAGVGLGAQALALAGVQYLEKRVHGTEQDEIARVAGTLPVGGLSEWQVSHSVPIEADERGSLTVTRSIGAGPLDCKEIVFSVDTLQDKAPHRAFYTATVCRDGEAWKWATAEPATERWGALQ